MSNQTAPCPAGFAKQNGSNVCTPVAQPSYSSIIEQSIPGFSGLTSSASSVINDLLSGGSAAGPAQNQAAKFGVSSGMPGSGVANAFGYDLYNKRANESRQRGLDDLLKMVTGYSGSAFATPGELLNKDTADRAANVASYNSVMQNLNAQRQIDDAARLASKPKWGTVTSGWDAVNGRPGNW